MKTEIEQTAENIIKGDVYINQDALVRKLFDAEILSYDDIDNATEPLEDGEDEDTEPRDQEVFEWWAVSDYLVKALRDIGEPVVESEYGNWWGRTCSGQAIIMDGTFQRIARKIHASLAA